VLTALFTPRILSGMFWHLLLVLFSPLASLMSGLLRDDRDRQILALRQQVLILQRQVGKRPRLSRVEKLAMRLTCVRMKQTELLDCLMIVKPATLIGWHRQIVCRHWTFHTRSRPGRPRTDAQAEQLVVRLARENANWGCGKIAGEMRKLGFVRFGRSTAQRILQRHGLWPRPRQGGLSWHDFLGHYGQFIWACDFFTVTTANLRTYYVLFSIEIASRRIVFWNVSEAPDGIWTAQQFRNLSLLDDQPPRYLLHDRDSKFTAHGDALLGDVGSKVIRLPVRSPNLNAYAERWVRTVREECLDRVIVLNESHLRWVLREFIRYYNERRPHRSLDLRPPEGPVECCGEGEGVRRLVIGGLVNDYYRKAA
jgi:putative transposase